MSRAPVAPPEPLLRPEPEVLHLPREPLAPREWEHHIRLGAGPEAWAMVT